MGDVETMRALGRSQVGARLLRPGDTLLERSGGTGSRPVGCAVTFLGSRPTISSNFVSRLRPAAEVLPRYLTLILAAMYEARWNTAWYTQTTGIQNLDSEGYLTTLVPALDLDAQRERVEGAESAIDERVQAEAGLEQLLHLLDERKRALITACVTREFDVNAASDRAGDAALVGLPR